MAWVETLGDSERECAHEWKPYPSLLSERETAFVTEKIDGSNASLVLDGKTRTLRYFSCNRELLVAEDHKFHGFHTGDLFDPAKLEATLPPNYSVYGEVFGGWDGITSRGAVATRVAYGHPKRFVVFGVRYPNGDWMRFQKMQAFCASHGLESVCVVFKGPVGEAFAFCAARRSGWVSAYADPHVDALPASCLGEGFVIHFQGLIVKQRNPAFIESGSVLRSGNAPKKDPARRANAKSKLLQGATEEEIVARLEEEIAAEIAREKEEAGGDV